MDLNQLQYFQAIARLGNISKASNELFITQPNLSKSIARLEKELGVLLFDHRKGRITLNEYGQVFLSSVNRSFSELEYGIKEIRHLYETNENILSLASSMSDILPDILKSFYLEHPNIRVNQYTYTPVDITTHLLDRSIDLALTFQYIGKNDIVFNILSENEFVILVNARHPLSSRKKIFVKELMHERFICDVSRLNEKMLRTICMKAGFEPNIVCDVESSDLIFNLLESNYGIIFMPIAQFHKLKLLNPSSTIQAIHIKDDIPTAIIGIAHHKSYVFSQAAKMFYHFVKDWLVHEAESIKQICKEDNNS
jgi:DNA-binding transcriptional LysR family regulator